MGNFLNNVRNRVAQIKSSQNNSQNAVQNFSEEGNNILSLSQNAGNLENFTNKILERKEITSKDIGYVIDFLNSVWEIRGSSQVFSGAQIAWLFENLRRYPTMDNVIKITRTAGLRDIAERYVINGPISFISHDGLPIMHKRIMSKNYVSETDIDNLINYFYDMQDAVKSESREYSQGYLMERFEELKRNPTMDQAKYITRAFGLREIAEKFVEDKKSPIAQGIRYNEIVGKPFSEKILDGMIDGGGWAEFFDNINEAKRALVENPEFQMVEFYENGKKKYGISPREFIKIDYGDENLQGLIWNMKNRLLRKDDKTKAREVAEMVFYLATNKWEVGFEDRSWKLSGVVSLLDAFNQGAAVCRHRSILFHILAQEVGLDTRLVKWYIVENGQMLWKHVWNEVKIGDEYKVIDVTYHQWEPTRLKDYSELPSYSIMRGENDFVSIAELVKKRKPGHI